MKTLSLLVVLLGLTLGVTQGRYINSKVMREILDGIKSAVSMTHVFELCHYCSRSSQYNPFVSNLKVFIFRVFSSFLQKKVCFSSYTIS